VFILSAHVGFWELVPPVVALYRGPMSIVVRPADNPHLDRELCALRERFGNEVIPKRGAARKMLERLRGGGRVGILIDQRVQPKEGIEVPFFGRPAQTSPVLARLSLRTGAAVVPVAAFPEPGGRYRLVARPAILPPEGAKDDEASVAALTRRYLEVAEDDIRAHPAQWLWMHRRWR
jgi:KDO2-lipid IV(A) lauroyltransferase